jgi:putative hydrolase of the HAD superfamily
MKTLSKAERLELVELLRELSPSKLAVELPDLRPDLESLADALLPRRPRAILFDVYGTLLMSAAGGEPNLAGDGDAGGGAKARTLLEKELNSAGYREGVPAFAGAVARLISMTREESFARTPNPEIDIEDLVARLLPDAASTALRRLALLLELSRNPCAPMPGARALLERLRPGDVRLGIVSNAQFYTPLLMEALLGQSPEELGFEAGLSALSYEGGIAKPDPALFMRAAGALLESGMSPGEILVVGNSSDNDIAPARKLGFMTALFAGDARSFRPSAPGSPGAQPNSLLRGFDEFEAVFPSAS